MHGSNTVIVSAAYLLASTVEVAVITAVPTPVAKRVAVVVLALKARTTASFDDVQRTSFETPGSAVTLNSIGVVAPSARLWCVGVIVTELTAPTTT
jgi:hypothetical protein